MHSVLTRSRRWPAATLAVAFLAYAAGKAIFAVQGRLGLPGGPAVSAEEARFAGSDVALAQWQLAAMGLLGAALVLLTMPSIGRRLPRPVILVVLAGLLLGVGSAAAVMIADGLFGLLGAGWQWYHGLVGFGLLALLVLAAQPYLKMPGRVDR